MANRSLSMVLGLSMLAGVSPRAVLAQQLEQPQQEIPEAENARQRFEGVVNSNAVYVRSGPGENYYPTVKLDKGAAVTVVGITFDWLKVLPPEGSFSYVAKAHVEKRGDGTVGRVARPDLNVRAGSSLNAMKTKVQTKLNEGDDVTILGEQDEYFKIKPPAGAYLYIHKQFVDPVKALPTAGAAETGSGATADTTGATAGTAQVESTGTSAMNDAAANGSTSTSETPVAPGADASATAGGATDAVAGAPATQPSAAAGLPSDEARFDALEAKFKTTSDMEILEQPVDELLAEYQALVKSDSLPESMRRIADHRIASLKVRAEAKENLLAVRKIQEEVAQRRQALKAEQEELEQRMRENDVKVYTAVGQLQTSSLQQGSVTLYRLTDPANGRTIVYLRSNDPKVVTMLGQFIGIRGDITNDQQLNLRVIDPTTVEAVDPSLLHTKVAAQVYPPSMLPTGTQASTGGDE